MRTIPPLAKGAEGRASGGCLIGKDLRALPDGDIPLHPPLTKGEFLLFPSRVLRF
jgi:hypothetical protein